MNEREALTKAIFALNTLDEPLASDPKDVDELLDHVEEIIEALVGLRDTLREGSPYDVALGALSRVVAERDELRRIVAERG